MVLKLGSPSLYIYVISNTGLPAHVGILLVGWGRSVRVATSKSHWSFSSALISSLSMWCNKLKSNVKSCGLDLLFFLIYKCIFPEYHLGPGN